MGGSKDRVVPELRVRVPHSVTCGACGQHDQTSERSKQRELGTADVLTGHRPGFEWEQARLRDETLWIAVVCDW